MTQNPPPAETHLLYRVIIDDDAPIPAISSYRAVRNALAALSLGARNVQIESRPAVPDPQGNFHGYPLDDWDIDAPSMAILESELLHQVSTVQPALTLPIAIRSLGRICTFIEKTMTSNHRNELTNAETEILANAMQKVIFFLEQEEEEM